MTPLEAANQLLARPWAGLAAQRKSDNEASMNAALADKTLVRPKALKWSFSIKLREGDAKVDIASPPGFTSASPSRIDFAVPRVGGWGFSIGGRVKGNAKIKSFGEEIFEWSPSFRFGLAIRDFRLRSNMTTGTGTNGVPRLTGVELNPRLVIAGDGSLPVSIPISMTTSVQGGKIELVGQFTSVEVGLPGVLSARMTGTVRMSFERGGVTGVEVEDLIDVKTSTVLVKLSLGGSFRVTLPKNVGSKTIDFKLLSVQGRLPSFDDLDELLRSLERPLPQQWGERTRAGGLTPPPPTGVDYATPAIALEQGIASEHLPHGAVLNRNCDSFDRRRQCVNPLYSGEEDSAIWSGHYLAAEAFRYAAMRNPAALERVKLALSGIQRLFDVTTDAAVVDKRRVAVVGRGLLARTAWPYTGSARTAAHYAKGALNARECYYERPEGGWRVGNRAYRTYAEIPRTVALQEVTPVGTIWRGWGCGENHPVSRDQYVGVFLGLSLAHQLVDDAEVKAGTGSLIERALDDLLRNGWNVRLPPRNRIAETSSFFGDFPKQLGFLRIGATVNPAKYGRAYADIAPAADLAWFPVWFSTFDPIFQYYKFNLSHAALTPSLVLETDPTLRAGYQRAADVMWGAVSHHRNAYFALLRVLMRPPGERAAYAATRPAGSNPALTPSEEVRSILADWVKRWNVVKTASGMPQYAIGDPNVQIALYPDGFGRFEQVDGAQVTLARYALPPSGRKGRDMDFMWQRHPFKTAFSSTSDRDVCRNEGQPTAANVIACASTNRVGPGVDYLLPYWMAVYLGVLPKPTGP